MVSEAKGIMYVPVWVDNGVVKALVNSNGQIPVQISGSDVSLDVNLQASDITLPVSEQSPITDLPVRLYTFYNGSWQNAPTETSGALHVHIRSQTGTQLIQQIMPSLLQPGMNSYIGADWQKQPMMWGITERWVESLDLTCDASGYVLVRTTAVASGYIHVVEAIACKLSQRQTTSVSLECRGNSINVPLNAVATLAANTYLFWVGRASMQEGDQVQMYMGSTQNNDTFAGRVWGYKMKVDD